ncbi:hypothetical protein F5B22DRAFT_653414 [Xylaria bambusicola]|uniref:uncharacterized protein n=1 Tax=Xylaria bambusicola TaxID=326684 RepID=UPI0020085DFE|nr:uncharacterized protein F5B22DRAFT_653414 [Xylaria bambusicola]KAI0520987.1 hypothetical protein F5B22DRAFT_653414 [Xylaria bambusicola]
MSPLNKKYDAKSLLNMIKNEALAFQRPHSSRLQELVACFNHCQQEAAARSPVLEQLKDLILRFMELLDTCFFFETLRKKSQSGQPTILLLIKDDYSTVDSVGIRGLFRGDEESITIYLRELPKGRPKRYAIEWVLHTLLHECVHAFIHLNCDESHPKHYERVEQNGQHGSIFRDMYRLISDRLKELFDSPAFDHAREMDPEIGTFRYQDSVPGGPRPASPPYFPPGGPPSGPQPSPFPVHGGFPGGPPPRGPPCYFPPPGYFPPSGGPFPPRGFPPGPPGGFPY